MQKYHRGERQNVRSREAHCILLKHGGKWLKRAVCSITKRETIKVLDDVMAEGKYYMANRTYAAMSTLFKWCLRRDIIEVDPMAALTKPFANERPRNRIYSDNEIRAIWQAADQLSKAQGAFVKLILLTGKRRGALAAMRYDEIADGIWKPPGRNKSKRVHPTPLPAQRIIAGLLMKPSNPCVFAGHRHGKPIFPQTDLMNAVRKLSGIEDYRFHTHRHTVETRLAALRVPAHIRDLCLDHAPARGAGTGYDHHDYADEIAQGYEQWGTEIERIVVGEGDQMLR